MCRGPYRGLVLPQRKPPFLSNLVQYTGVNVSKQARMQYQENHRFIGDNGEQRRTVRAGFQPENRGSIPLGGDHAAAFAYHLPVFGIEAQGSCFGLGSPFCRNSIEILSGERMKAM